MKAHHVEWRHHALVDIYAQRVWWISMPSVPGGYLCPVCLVDIYAQRAWWISMPSNLFSWIHGGCSTDINEFITRNWGCMQTYEWGLYNVLIHTVLYCNVMSKNTSHLTTCNNNPYAAVHHRILVHIENSFYFTFAATSAIHVSNADYLPHNLHLHVQQTYSPKRSSRPKEHAGRLPVFWWPWLHFQGHSRNLGVKILNFPSCVHNVSKSISSMVSNVDVWRMDQLSRL